MRNRQVRNRRFAFSSIAALAFAAIMPATAAAQGESVWIEDGRSRITVVADARFLELDPAARRNRTDAPLHWAAHDLAEYLEQMTGARPEIATEAAPDTLPVRIRVKEEAGELGKSSELGDAYRVDIGAEGVQLIGETPRAAAYAVYQVLHDLGVRWYGPETWTEIVPRHDRVAFDISIRDFAPDYHSRNLWGDRRWMLRNRMGGPQMPQGHGFHRFMQGMEPRDKEPLVERHPEYYPIIDGRIQGRQANLSHPDVLERAITSVRNLFERNPDALGTSLGPDDGALRDERPESRALMSGDPDPLFPHRPDSTDIVVWFINQVAEAIEDEYPDKLLGFYVYSNHKSVPNLDPHPMIFPKIAPISYSRYTSVGTPNAPTSMMLKQVMQQWVERSPKVGYYLYNFNLADCAMPFTRVAAFRRDIPNLFQWGMEYASIESHANWHTMIPGNYMIGRLLWDVETDVDGLLDEFYRLYYGPAADAMRVYNETLETAYETTSAYSGNLWSMHRILTPSVMTALENSLDAAEEAARGLHPYEKRVGVSRIPLTMAQAWFQAHYGLQNWDIDAVRKGNRRFTEAYEEGREQYENFFAPMIIRYWRAFHQPSFEGAVNIAGNGRVLLRLPDVWKAYFDQTTIGESMALYHPLSPKDSWLDMKTYSANIDEQGFPYFRGLIWYAIDLETPAFTVEEGEEIFLWFGGNDSTTRVYVDGHLAGDFRTSNFRPGEVPVTPLLRPGETQHLVVQVDNRPVYELGTGGIMRPVVLYKRALEEGEEAVQPPEDYDPEAGPLFTVD